MLCGSSLSHPIFSFGRTASNGDGRLLLQTNSPSFPTRPRPGACTGKLVFTSFSLPSSNFLLASTGRLLGSLLALIAALGHDLEQHFKKAGILPHVLYITSRYVPYSSSSPSLARSQPHPHLSSSSPLVLPLVIVEHGDRPL